MGEGTQTAYLDLGEGGGDRYAFLRDALRDIVLVIRPGDCRVLDANAAALAAYGYGREELLQLTVHDLRAPETRGVVPAQIREAAQRGVLFETRHLRKSGSTFPVEVSSRLTVLDAVSVLVSVVRDVSERKRAETYREMAQQLLRVLSRPGGLEATLHEALAVLKAATGVDAVAMRLEVGEDFPYFAQQGFPDDFVARENSLVAGLQEGGACRDATGGVCLECTCGLVLSGRIDPTNPLFTRGGSFWTNDSLPILALSPHEDPRVAPRNECIHRGYASIALIPVRAKGRIVGLLQLNDRRSGRFNPNALEALEGVADNVGEAVLRKQAEESLRLSEARYRGLVEAVPGVLYAYSDRRSGVYYSPQVESVLGYTADHLREHPTLWHDSIHPDDLPAVDRAIREGSGTRRIEVEYRIRDAQGGWRWFLDRSVHIEKGEGGETVIEGLALDMTKRKAAEEVAARLLEQTLRDGETKERLLREINHRVKNNLVSLLGLLLAEQHGAPPAGSPWAEAAVKRMADHIRGMLAAHELLSETAWAPVTLTDLAERILRHTLEAKLIEGRVTLGVTPSAAQISPRQVTGVALALNELATNTLKYAVPVGACVRVAARVEEGDGHCVLEYRDDGPGYPDAVLAGGRPSVGLGLVSGLVAGTLGGDLTLSNSGGAVATISISKEELTNT